MTLRTPPLSALRAFSAFVQSGSIALAAEELSLTQGAVAHQIRALENFLEIELVQKTGRSLALTDAGRHYGYQVRQALHDLSEATLHTQRKAFSTREDARAVRVSVLPSFAHGWLLPRLPSFFRAFPRVRLSLHCAMQYVDVNKGDVDCAIRFGHGQWASTNAKFLMPDSLLLVASPELLSEHGGMDLDRLLRLPYLHSSENLARWLATLNEMPTAIERPTTAIEFNDSTQLLEAVRLGLGVGLTRWSIADHLLQSGALVKAHHHECKHTSSYYALLPAGVRMHKAAYQFVSWLEAECNRWPA